MLRTIKSLVENKITSRQLAQFAVAFCAGYMVMSPVASVSAKALNYVGQAFSASSHEIPATKKVSRDDTKVKEAAPQVGAPAAQAAVDARLTEINQAYFDGQSIATLCPDKTAAEINARSQTFEAGRDTVFLIDPGHGLGIDIGASMLKIYDRNNASWFARVPDKYAQALVDAHLAPNITAAQVALNKTIEHFKAQTEREIARYDLNVRGDGYYNLVYVSQELGRNLGRSEHAVSAAIFKVAEANRVAIVEEKITQDLAKSVGERLQGAGYAVAFTHMSNDKTYADPFLAKKNGLTTRQALGYRTFVSRAMACSFNTVTLSFHADMAPNPKHEDSKLYVFNMNDHSAAILGNNLMQHWTQGGSYDVAKNEVDAKNLAIPRNSVNGALLETYQLGNEAGRTCAYNFQYDVNGMQTLVAEQTAMGLLTAARMLENQAKAPVPTQMASNTPRWR